MNKKVLLREHKRHTARRIAVASACYSRGEVPGVPPPPWRWGTPLSKGGVSPTPCPRLGYLPVHPRFGYPPVQGWGTPLYKAGSGYPPIQGWIGYPPRQGWIGMGYPPKVNRQTFPSINITFPRTTYVGCNKKIQKMNGCLKRSISSSRCIFSDEVAKFNFFY